MPDRRVVITPKMFKRRGEAGAWPQAEASGEAPRMATAAQAAAAEEALGNGRDCVDRARAFLRRRHDDQAIANRACGSTRRSRTCRRGDGGARRPRDIAPVPVGYRSWSRRARWCRRRSRRRGSVSFRIAVTPLPLTGPPSATSNELGSVAIIVTACVPVAMRNELGAAGGRIRTRCRSPSA